MNNSKIALLISAGNALVAIFTVAITVLALNLCLSSQVTAQAISEDVSLELNDLTLREALQLLSDEWGLALRADSLPESPIDFSVLNVSRDEALSQLLHRYQLDYRLGDALLRVGTAEQLRLEDGIRRRRQEAMQPLRTEYVHVSYADAGTLAGLIHGGDSSMLSERGLLRVDTRTNTLIITDTAGRLRAIRVLLSELDVPVSQVQIEARIVSATLDTGRELGMRWGLQSVQDMLQEDTRFMLQAGGEDASTATLGLLRNSRLLEWQLSALEHQGKAELIARPRVITQDNSPASIRSGVRVPYQAQAGGTAGGSITQFIDAVLSLDVTPLITPDGRIIMDLHIQQDSVAASNANVDVPAIDTNTMDTRVLIDNADTLVLGGIFREEQLSSQTGTPGLRHLPVLGRLFQREVNTTRRTELLVFITPVIIPAYGPPDR